MYGNHMWPWQTRARDDDLDMGFHRNELRTNEKRLSSGTTIELSKCYETKTQKFPARPSEPFHVSGFFHVFIRKWKKIARSYLTRCVLLGCDCMFHEGRRSFQEANGKSSHCQNTIATLSRRALDDCEEERYRDGVGKTLKALVSRWRRNRRDGRSPAMFSM